MILFHWGGSSEPQWQLVCVGSAINLLTLGMTPAASSAGLGRALCGGRAKRSALSAMSWSGVESADQSSLQYVHMKTYIDVVNICACAQSVESLTW